MTVEAERLTPILQWTRHFTPAFLGRRETQSFTTSSIVAGEEGGGAKVCRRLLGFGDELVGVVPVLQQVGGLLVVNSDVVVLKHSREKVVYFPGDVQDVAHSASDTQKDGRFIIRTLDEPEMRILF